MYIHTLSSLWYVYMYVRYHTVHNTLIPKNVLILYFFKYLWNVTIRCFDFYFIIIWICFRRYTKTKLLGNLLLFSLHCHVMAWAQGFRTNLLLLIALSNIFGLLVLNCIHFKLNKDGILKAFMITSSSLWRSLIFETF